VRLAFTVVLLSFGFLYVEGWLCTAESPCMCHHPTPGSDVYWMGCLMNPCPAMPTIAAMPAGSLFVHHPQVSGCDGMIPGVYYTPAYGGGACIPVGSVDSGFECCETTSGWFAAPNDPSCARDTVGVEAPVAVAVRHKDPPIIVPQPHPELGQHPHHDKKPHNGGAHSVGNPDDEGICEQHRALR